MKCNKTLWVILDKSATISKDRTYIFKNDIFKSTFETRSLASVKIFI